LEGIQQRIAGEPFLPAKFKVKDDTEFSMSPEFQMVVAKKESDLREMTSDLGGSLSITNKSVDNYNAEYGAMASTKVETTPLLE
jgi:hypothetical protein